MESDNDGEVVIVDQENDNAKRLYSSQGDTPGKPNRKSRRVSRMECSTSSRPLFQTPGTSPKVKCSSNYIL
jgi:hypothetical protein